MVFLSRSLSMNSRLRRLSYHRCRVASIAKVPCRPLMVSFCSFITSIRGSSSVLFSLSGGGVVISLACRPAVMESAG